MAALRGTLALCCASGGPVASEMQPAPPAGGQKRRMEDVISNCRFLDFRAKRIVMPWDRGVFGFVFGVPPAVEPLVYFSDPPWEPDSSAVRSRVQQASQEILPNATQKFARQRAQCAALFKSDDAVRFEALRKIKVLTLLEPAASSFGRNLVADAALLSDDSELQKSFTDAFANKSTATLAKRTASYWRFAEFCLASGLGAPLRADEATLYSYMKHLQANGAPTSGKSFLESWNFMSALLGFAPAAGSPVSIRVRGAAAALAATKKPLVQAAPLTVDMIRALERIVVKSPYPHWCVIAGHILFCVGSCARFSDTMYLDSLECSSADDVYLLEAASVSYKTAQGDRKNLLLPLLSLGCFLYTSAWGPAWMQARQDAGLSLKPSLPAFSEAAQCWLTRRMSTGELSLYLREFLVASQIDLPPASRVSSHSSKATMLSWLAKFGGISLEDRRIAGHHLDPASRSPLTYSRDELCRLMKIFSDILRKIRAGQFKPDDSRVMRLAVMIQASEGPQLQEKVVEHDPFVSDSEAEGSDLDVDDLEARAVGVPLDAALTAAQVSSVFSKMHIYSRTVHIQASEGAKFLCGRPITRNFGELDQNVPASDLLVCKRCSQTYKSS